MKSKPKYYTLETLRAEGNETYDSKYCLTEYDLHKINHLVSLIDRQANGFSGPGSDIEIDGVLWHRESLHGEFMGDLCEGGSHFCSVAGAIARMNTSGGPWMSLNSVGKIQNTGRTKKKQFWTWGHNGPCGGGGIKFQVEVSIFEPEPQS